MIKFFKRKLENWFYKLKQRFKKAPVKSTILSIISIFLIYFIAHYVYSFLGLFVLIAYIAACIYGFSEIIDKPHRTIIWAFGYLLATIAIAIFFVYLIPALKGVKDIASVVSALIILYLFVKLFQTSRKLKKK